MKLETCIFGLALAMGGLLPLSARADQPRPYHQAHRHGPGCQHAATPGGAPSQAGRYELRPVQRWVEGYSERVWVPRVCEHKHRRRWHKMKCHGGFYEDRWVPGHYQTVQEWVWVPHAPQYVPSSHGWTAELGLRAAL